MSPLQTALLLTMASRDPHFPHLVHLVPHYIHQIFHLCKYHTSSLLQRDKILTQDHLKRVFRVQISAIFVRKTKRQYLTFLYYNVSKLITDLACNSVREDSKTLELVSQISGLFIKWKFRFERGVVGALAKIKPN